HKARAANLLLTTGRCLSKCCLMSTLSMLSMANLMVKMGICHNNHGRGPKSSS
ncbi:hypothetical protein J1N35_043862, partial [Gossypium stocksii]